MLQEKRISSKINYEVLKSLNVGSSENNKPVLPPIPEDISFVSPKAVEIKEPAPVNPMYLLILFSVNSVYSLIH